jgi:hypothetical protein
MPPCFPAAFRPPAFASWASLPARGLRPPYGRPTAPPPAARTRTGFPCSARVRPGWLRVPSLPRGRRCPHGRSFSPAAACRITTASPYHPGPQPAPGRIGDEASARVHCYSPHTSLPLACGPRRNRALGLFPELRTRPGRTRQRTPERGQAWTLPGLRRWHQTSLLSTHSLTTCDLTSHERPNLRATTGDRRGVTPNSASPSAPPIRTGAAAGQQGSTTPGQRPRSSRSTRSARTSRRATRSFPRQRDAQRCGLHRLCDLRP